MIDVYYIRKGEEYRDENFELGRERAPTQEEFENAYFKVGEADEEHVYLDEDGVVDSEIFEFWQKDFRPVSRELRYSLICEKGHEEEVFNTRKEAREHVEEEHGFDSQGADVLPEYLHYPRSMKVGDVFVKNGRAFMVSPFGFEEIDIEVEGCVEA